MIRVKQDGEERQLSYEEFVREVQAGKIVATSLVSSDVLTSGTWRPAGELQFFRSWAPPGSIPPPALRDPATARGQPRREPVGSRPPGGGEAGSEAPAPTAGSAEDEPGVPREEQPADAPLPSSPHAGGPEREGGFSSPGFAAEGPVPGAERIPWERQDQIGFGRGLIGTIRLAFDDASEFARRVAAGDRLVPALAFGLVVTVITADFDAIYGIGALRMTRGLVEQMESQIPELFGNSGPPTPRDILFIEGMRILFYPLTVFVWAGVVHLFLRIFGRPQRRFPATFRVVSYAIAPLVLNILPFCGTVIGLGWMIVLTIRGLVAAQRTSTFACVIAVLLPAIAYILWMLLANEALVRSLPHLGGSA